MFILLSGAVIEGVVFGCVAVLWLIGRGRVPEQLGAHFLHRKATLELLKSACLAIILLAAIATVFTATVLHWNRDPEGPVLYCALIGVMILLKRELEGRFTLIDRLQAGGSAELAVADELSRLPASWTVEHNVLRSDGRGNVDHIVTRPDGECFVVETKSGCYRIGHLGQALGCAVGIKKDRRLRWTSPVICVDDPHQRPELKSHGKSHVWVVDRHQLAEWLPSATSTRRY
jgi:hypothetical protein